MATKQEIFAEVCNVMLANTSVFRGPMIAPPGHCGCWSSNDYTSTLYDDIIADPPPPEEDLIDTVYSRMQDILDAICTEKGDDLIVLVDPSA